MDKVLWTGVVVLASFLRIGASRADLWRMLV
jgi:hypothetical protein